MDVRQFAQRLPNAALVFRGYNVTNLGRSSELLASPRYGPVVEQVLRDASVACCDITGRQVDLVDRVRSQRETSLETYAEAIALIMAMEIAQLECLKQFFQIDYRRARMMYGYSLGELSAVVAGGVFSLSDALRIPVSLAEDCVALAHDVTLGVLFSRGPALPMEDIKRLCVRINQEDQGLIGISALLSPNSMLLIGQRGTIDRFKDLADKEISVSTSLRKNSYRWPPLHTPIVWLHNIPNRSGVLMNSLPGGCKAPTPPLLSLVTGKFSYNDYNSRELLQQWTDHPQRLWDGVYETLSMGIDLIVHVGPEPNIVPATYRRLKDNVEAQTRGSVGLRALSVAVRRPWLGALLPDRAALLRAPLVKQVNLEDWLLDVKV